MGCGNGKHVFAIDHRPNTVTRIEMTGHRQLIANAEDLDEDSLLDSEIDLSSSEKLQEYTHQYPEFSRELNVLYCSIEKLRRLSEKETAFSDKDLLSKINKEVLKLRKRSIKAAFSPGTSEDQKYSLIANFILDIEGAALFSMLAKQLFDSYIECVKIHRRNEVQSGNPSVIETDRMDHLTSETLILVLLVIQNFAEFHKQFCVACAKTTEVVSLCLMQSRQVEDVFTTTQAEGSGRPVRAIRILGCCFNILYNLARKTDLVKANVDFEGKETLVYFAKSDIAIVSPLALLSLAYVVDEESNHLILAAEEILGALTSLLQKAFESERRKFDGFSAKELAEGLSRLAINDTNKRVLGEKGAIQVLVSIIKTSNDNSEKASAVNALWVLAFDENNKKAITQDKETLDILRRLQQSDDPEVQKAAAGALWELEGKTARNSQMTKATGNHVMISYQWDSQEVLVEVKNRLQASGYRVWMDLEQMGGSTLEAMAKAVENASVILVCVSHQYKESPNCRSEAEYAYQLRKDIIPLMMQQNYKPDGWLGMIVGTKLWIDLRNSFNVEAATGKLKKELGDRGRENQGNYLTVEHEKPVEKGQELTPELSGVADWTANEVKDWLKDIGLDDICKAVLPKLNGQALIYLYALRDECPDYFYRCLETNLNLRDMFDLFKFREELSKLMKG